MAIFSNRYAAKNLAGCFGYNDLDYEKVTYWSEAQNNNDVVDHVDVDVDDRRCSLTDWSLPDGIGHWNVSATVGPSYRTNNWHKQVKHVGRSWKRRFYNRYSLLSPALLGLDSRDRLM